MRNLFLSHDNHCVRVQHQNGSIVDGLTVWKSNVDKRFEGVEECYICFYILHGANHSLPKVNIHHISLQWFTTYLVVEKSLTRNVWLVVPGPA